MKEPNKRIVTALATVLMLIVLFKGTNLSITGFSVYDPDNEICHRNLDSCIDLNGDGRYDSTDQNIFACLLPGAPNCPTDWNATYGHPKSYFENKADFDNDGVVSADIDFQRCFVPIRDEAIDKGNDGNITCNVDVSDDEVIEELEKVCYGGCPDLNGDGYVDDSDGDILVSLLGDVDYDSKYPMADLNNDSSIGWEDRNCMSAFFERYVLCNMPRYYQHTNLDACADLMNAYDLNNDGFVNETDLEFYEEYATGYSNLIDYNSDGKINWQDRWIFSQYLDYKQIVNANRTKLKVVDCNLYHAPWHTGGIDQNNTNVSAISGSIDIGGSNYASQSFKPFKNPTQFNQTNPKFGYITKVRLYLENNYPNETAPKINVEIRADDNGEPLMELSGLIDKTTIEGPTETGPKWVTAYFTSPKKLLKLKNYQIVLNTNESAYTDQYSWHYTTGIMGEVLNSSNKGLNWSSNGTIDFLFQTWMTTAYADLNGDGIVDETDKETILDIPDQLTPNGTDLWNASFDLNNDSIINDEDILNFTTYWIQEGNNSGKDPIINSTVLEIQGTTPPYTSELFGGNKAVAKNIIANKTTYINRIELNLRMNKVTDKDVTLRFLKEDKTELGNSTVSNEEIKPTTFDSIGFNFTKPIPINKNSQYYIVVSAKGAAQDAYEWQAVY